MRRLVLAMVAAATILTCPEALSFQVGEHVTVDNKSGTVIEDTGKLVKVHIDGSGYSADVGLWYEKEKVNTPSGTNGATAPSVSNNLSGAQVNNGSSPSGTGSSKKGERINMGGVKGTILEDNGKLIKVHLDGSGYSPDVGVWYDKEQLKNSGGTSGGGISINQTSIMTNPGGTLKVEQRANGGNAASTGKPVQQNATQSTQGTEKGVGAPPDGIYTCNKISGRSYIHIGTIEIRGRTYKGFSSQQGSFHPYSMNASGDMIWTGGLTGMPDGWTIKPAKYVGPDSQGHPLIRVYYSSARGAAEVIDATKEK